MPPRFRTPRIAADNALSPSASRSGVGLIENDQKGVTEQSAGERDALALASRQCRAVWAYIRLIGIGEAEDHIVDAGGLGRCNDGVAVLLFLEPADIFRDRAFEQRHVLEASIRYAGPVRRATSPGVPRRRGEWIRAAAATPR